MGRKPKGVVETIVDGVDKVLHPERHESDSNETDKADGLESSPVAKVSKDGDVKVETSAPETDAKTTESETHADADHMSEHQKFDKFKNTEGSNLDDK